MVVFVHARVRPQGGNHWQDVSLADAQSVMAGWSRCKRSPTGRKPCAGLELKQSEIGER
jgi:hypothetical protein